MKHDNYISRNAFAIFILMAVSLAFFLAHTISRLGMIQFGGMDGGALINAAWQLHLGYRPYTEVVTSVPPIFLFLAKWSFDLFGVYWRSFVSMTVVASMISFLVQVYLCRRLNFGYILSLLLPFTIQCVTFLPISWLWYNQLTSVIASTYLLSAFLLLYSRDPTTKAIFVIFGTMLFLSKPNVAAPLILISLIILAYQKKGRDTIMILFSFCAVLATLLLLINRTDPITLLKSYLIAGGRVLSIKNIYLFLIGIENREVLLTFFWLAFSLASAAISILFILFNFGQIRDKDGGRFISAVIPLALGGIFCGFIAMATNNEHNMVDTPLILIGCTIIASLSTRLGSSSKWLRVLIYSLLFISLVPLSNLGYQFGLERLRIRSIEPGAYYEDVPLHKIEQPLFFKDVWVGPKMIQTLNDISSCLAHYGLANKPDANIFFCSKVDFAYAVYNILPRAGLPLWWESFSDDKKKQTQEMVHRFKEASFSHIIFRVRPRVLDDMTFMPSSLVQYIHDNYGGQQMDHVTIYVK